VPHLAAGQPLVDGVERGGSAVARVLQLCLEVVQRRADAQHGALHVHQVGRHAHKVRVVPVPPSTPTSAVTERFALVSEDRGRRRARVQQARRWGW
jgi:hypothetical protein